ncbi:murein hydrolase activator EnvC family protein [Faecalibacter rhinopitheci]|uniref:Peptidoglycan DD-metalloendopeptidase family protein n=1 Tax=Faecalibacter rhinopitheci TaxID=2779678 RepID=A0A8J7KD18_9FLAO|nr:M23 family metallopeptidase [Faecalibacter rhinopitheci]MBF0596836.1 peptidoglycan DD-metalloendopeptidase family protein [Faecalibacter rhinopitheci]MBQ0148247.1 peptidoglycan DD-metalloendopeptidase family protein [Candidatus Onthonaster equi]
MRIVFTALLFSLSVFSNAQTPYNKENLQKQNAQLKKEILQLGQTLKKNQEGSKLNVEYVQNLSKKIDTQSKLVNNLSKEKRFIEDEIYLTQLDINKLSRELEVLKAEYKKVLVKAYKNRSVDNKFLFILSSKSLGEAYRRVKYLEKYSDYQLGQAEEIIGKTTDIRSKQKAKEKAKQDKERVLTQQQLFSQSLEKERLEKQRAVEEFKKNEGLIASEINAKEAAQRQVDGQIKAIIEEEIRQAKIRAEKDKKAWDLARSSNTIAAYNEYLKENPKGDYATSARRNIASIEADAKAWNIARSTHTKASYQGYLKSNPKGSFASTARTEVAKFEKLEREAEEERQRLIAQRKAEEEARIKAEKEEDQRKIAAARVEAENKAKAEAAAKVVTKVPEKEKVVIADAPKPAENFADTPEVGGISGDFIANKGRLPWPVAKGKVVSHFGTNSHPILSNISTQNSGVDISTGKGSSARAVFEGIVQGVIQIPGGNKTVLVRHGTYFTTYSNLTSVNVAKDDRVSRGQLLGLIDTTPNGETIMNFQVWNGATKQNPALWIAGM